MEVNLYLRWQPLSEKILLITALDETHRQPLLESQGYIVRTARIDDALRQLESDDYQLILVPTERGSAETLEFCEQLKNRFPELCIAVIAQRAEYIPLSNSVDAVIREQHSPGRFLAAVKKLLDIGSGNEQSFSASDGN